MARPQLTAVNHYDVFPFNHGGSLGIRGLYKALSEWFDVNIITFVTHDYFPEEVSISEHVKVMPVVLPEELRRRQYGLYAAYGMSDLTLVDSSPAVVRWYHTYPEIIDRVQEIAKDSVVVLAEHVFTWNIVKTACSDKHLWYRANNVEYDYKLTTWEKIGCPKDLLKETYDLERACCRECERVLAVSQLEIDRFMQLYELPEELRRKFINIRSGYDTDALKTVLPSQRTGLPDGYRFSGLFVASDTPNTRRAAEYCIRTARECPDIQIVMLGGVGKAFQGKPLPENVLVTGIVPDEEKFYYLTHCDFALNPMEEGAGINVKMFEYFAFGLPVITSDYGLRGIEAAAGRDCIVTEARALTAAVREFCALTVKERDEIAGNALDLLTQKYSWRSLGQMIAEEIEALYQIPVSQYALPLEEIALYETKATEPYLPSRPFYIRCAGEWGQNCLRLLRERGLVPQAFVDADPEKQGKFVEDIPVISLERYLAEREGSEIIVAVGVSMEKIAAELVSNGVPPADISLAWDGRQIMTLSDLSGSYPYYHDREKWRKRIMSEA